MNCYWCDYQGFAIHLHSAEIVDLGRNVANSLARNVVHSLHCHWMFVPINQIRVIIFVDRVNLENAVYLGHQVTLVCLEKQVYLV